MDESDVKASEINQNITFSLDIDYPVDFSQM